MLVDHVWMSASIVPEDTPRRLQPLPPSSETPLCEPSGLSFRPFRRALPADFSFFMSRFSVSHEMLSLRVGVKAPAADEALLVRKMKLTRGSEPLREARARGGLRGHGAGRHKLVVGIVTW